MLQFIVVFYLVKSLKRGLRHLPDIFIFKAKALRHVDPEHPHWRRFTKKYQRKQRIVKNLWIASGLTMLLFPSLQVIVGLGLFTTFLSFVILDETS